MQANEWIKQAQGKGWRVDTVRGKVLALRCNMQGCPGHVSLPLDNLGSVPDPCAHPHEGQYAQHTYEQYKTLIAEFRRRRVQLGLDQADLCNAMGVTDGYVNKLESFKKTASPPTLLLWAQTLGLALTTAPAVLPGATLRAIEERQAKPYAFNQTRFKHA